VRTVQECIDEEEDMTDSCSGVGGRRELEADSGISRTDDSLRNDESSEQEMIDTDSASPSSGSAKYTAVYFIPYDSQLRSRCPSDCPLFTYPLCTVHRLTQSL